MTFKKLLPEERLKYSASYLNSKMSSMGVKNHKEMLSHFMKQNDLQNAKYQKRKIKNKNDLSLSLNHSQSYAIETVVQSRMKSFIRNNRSEPLESPRRAKSQKIEPNLSAKSFKSNLKGLL